ncbi:unnamed protein product [Anisakis simplex]|uniref:Conserved plasma membrane protein n=1 Tax=Anisakis simplex TaxID=6269 RepID=A0A0M3K587_ANISI|nr:unnamed protein product [Anisakis simplex]
MNVINRSSNVSYTSSSAASLRHVGDGPSTSPPPNEAETLPNGRLTLRDRITENIGNWLDQLAEAFAETNEDDNSNSNMNSQSKPAEPEKLSARALRRDIRRCLNCSKPYLQTWVVLHDLLIWKDPLTSLMAFFIYAHMFYTGHLWPTFLGLILLQLFFNYLTTQKKIKVGLYFMPRQDIEPPRFDRSGVSLIFDIAYKGQILFHFLANCLEKVNK